MVEDLERYVSGLRLVQRLGGAEELKVAALRREAVVS